MTEHARGDAPSEMSRRSVLGAVGTLGGGGLTGLSALAASSGPAAAVDGDPAAFEAGDAPTVTSNDGRVEAVYLSPTVDVSWTDFGDGVDAVTVTVAAGSDHGVDEVYRETLTAVEPEATPGDVASVEAFEHGAVEGKLAVGFERADATARGEAVTTEALSDSDIAGGETATTTLDIVLRADVVGGEDEATVVRTTTVDVTVENPAGDADAGGTVGIDTA
ncbi:hypothetical protein [Halorubrum sp. DTA46]|uniref:hypothetical protein n=1 Tax=Halorubrum sp. DTA46 TaxID=3402162 RepID=UPI003AAF1CCE